MSEEEFREGVRKEAGYKDPPTTKNFVSFNWKAISYFPSKEGKYLKIEYGESFIMYALHFYKLLEV